MDINAKFNWIGSFISKDADSIKFHVPEGKKIRFLDVEFDKNTNLESLLWKEIHEEVDEYFISSSIVDNSTCLLNNTAVEFVDLFSSTGYKEYDKKKFRAVKSGVHVDVSVDVFFKNQGRPKWWFEQTILVFELKKTFKQAVFQHAIQQ